MIGLTTRWTSFDRLSRVPSVLIYYIHRARPKYQSISATVTLGRFSKHLRDPHRQPVTGYWVCTICERSSWSEVTLTSVA